MLECYKRLILWQGEKFWRFIFTGMLYWGAVWGGQRDFISVNINDCQMFYKINRLCFLKQDKLLFSYSCMCMWVFLHAPFCAFVWFKLNPAPWVWGLCTNVAPVRASLYLVLLVAVFVCVVPDVQPVLSTLRYSITGSPVFRCAQVSQRCDWDVCISHTARHPVIMFLVYQIEAQPAVQSFSLDTHAHTHTYTRWRTE